MRHPSLLLLLALLPLVANVQAEEPGNSGQPAEVISQPSTGAINTAVLQRELAAKTQQADELLRLRKDNQKLSLQLREAIARQPQGLLSEQQKWYLLGGLTVLLGTAIGALLSGSRRRRGWIN